MSKSEYLTPFGNNPGGLDNRQLEILVEALAE